MICLGVVEKQGNYNGQEYHNVTLYCTADEKDFSTSIKKRYGDVVTELKLKYQDFLDIAVPMDKIVGQQVKPIYNRFGNVVEVKVGA